MKNWNVRKAVVAPRGYAGGASARKSLSWPHLVALGVGAIVGTGILTLIGVGAGKAGPAVILSFAIAGVICACAALAYAEMATMIPASGSAYTYSYVVFGELIAWMIGCRADPRIYAGRERGRGRLVGLCRGLPQSIGMGLPDALIEGPELGGIINLPAIFIIGVVAGLLIAGTRESATLNAILVLIKLAALALFVAVTLPVSMRPTSIRSCPTAFRSSGQSGSEVGVMAAAAIIFFAFYGFDAIATAAEEAKNPSRDLAIGIVGSMLVCVAHLHGGRRRRDRRPRLHRLRQQPRAAGADPARDRQPMGGADPRRLGGDRAADRDPRLLLRPEPHLLRHRPRRAAAEQPGPGFAAGHAGADHHLHRGRDVDLRRPDPAGRDRRARQCRHARRLHRGLRGDARAAPPRAGTRAQVPGAAAVGWSGSSASSAVSICSSACRTGRSSSSCGAGDRPDPLRDLRQPRRGAGAPGGRERLEGRRRWRDRRAPLIVRCSSRSC